MHPKAGRFIDPLSDFGFKHLFGNEPNKDILIDFLNQLFKGQKEITDLTYNSTEHAGVPKNLKRYFLTCLVPAKTESSLLLRCKGPNSATLATGQYFILHG